MKTLLMTLCLLSLCLVALPSGEAAGCDGGNLWSDDLTDDPSGKGNCIGRCLNGSSYCELPPLEWG